MALAMLGLVVVMCFTAIAEKRWLTMPEAVRLPAAIPRMAFTIVHMGFLQYWSVTVASAGVLTVNSNGWSPQLKIELCALHHGSR